jgi:hypothetical protein
MMTSVRVSSIGVAMGATGAAGGGETSLIAISL